MNGRRFLCGTIALTLTMAVVPLGADDQLAEVKRLYLTEQYEDALAVLSRGLPPGSSEGDEYRVLCLLGLGRAADAEQIVERMILKNPLASLDLEGRSPKFVATYQAVRRRILALVARTMYGLARASFDAGHLTVASAQFKELLALLEKGEGSTEPQNDLKMLADGFVRLSHREPEAAKPPANAPPPQISVEPAQLPVEEMLAAAVAAEPILSTPVEAKPFAPWRPQVFGSEDLDVTPPTIIDQRMPSWMAPAAYRNETFRGTLEILIGEDGLVVSARTVERTHPLYDVILVSAAKQWQYEPALRDGQPVKYRKTLQFTLRGR